MREIKRTKYSELFKLITAIEVCRSSTEIKSVTLNGEIVAVLNQSPSKLIIDLEMELNKLGLVLDFEWQQWREGERYLNLEDYSQLDWNTVCRLLTVFILAKGDGYESLKAVWLADGVLMRLLNRFKVIIEQRYKKRLNPTTQVNVA